MLTAIPSPVDSVLCSLGAIEPTAGWKEEEAVGVSVSQAIPSEGLQYLALLCPSTSGQHHPEMGPCSDLRASSHVW